MALTTVVAVNLCLLQTLSTSLMTQLLTAHTIPHLTNITLLPFILETT